MFPLFPFKGIGQFEPKISGNLWEQYKKKEMDDPVGFYYFPFSFFGF